MSKLDVPEVWRQEILNYLVEENLLDERRYTMAYSIGKLRNNQWGKQKIYAGLLQKKISSSIIKEALNSVDAEEYLSVLRQVMEHKIRRVGDISVDTNKKKLLNYALQKGFESNLIWQIINETEINNKYGNKR